MVEGSATVGDGAADGRIRAVGSDEAFLDCGVALGTQGDGVAIGLPGWELAADGVHELQEIGLDDEAVVVVGVEVGTVAVGSIAEEPVVVLAEGVVDAELVPRESRLIDDLEQGLVHGCEEEPVVVAPRYDALLDEGLCEALTSGGVERMQELVRSTEQRQREE